MNRRQGLLLIQAPNVKLMDRGNALDLIGVSANSSSGGKSHTFSKSCLTSLMLTLVGALSNRINPALRT